MYQCIKPEDFCGIFLNSDQCIVILRNNSVIPPGKINFADYVSGARGYNVELV